MIPYFPQPEVHRFGPVSVHAFGAIVSVAVIVGWRMVVAHLYSVLAYFPREEMEPPLLLLKFWEDISSFGGFAGGLRCSSPRSS